MGATEASGSHPQKGNTAAFTPKPKKAATKAISRTCLFPAARLWSRIPP